MSAILSGKQSHRAFMIGRASALRSANDMIGQLQDALFRERAKVAALERELLQMKLAVAASERDALLALVPAASPSLH